MSAPSAAESRSAAGRRSPWLIAGVVSIATFMEVLDTTIANVALRNIAGGLAAGLDESTWIITSYLVANAVILPISGWLANVIGRKRFYMGCVATFTLASLLCGLSDSLAMLIGFRILQGAGGGGLASSEQAILADSFPPEKRGLAFSIYGIAVVVAPTIGPTLGGYITDNYSWHWVFFINVPMGLLSLLLVGWLLNEPEVLQRERREMLAGGLRIDFVGFVLTALALGCLEVVLDRGQTDDWFSSPFITGFAVVSVLALVAMVIWESTCDEPIVDVPLLGTRQFATCFGLMLVVGAILIGTTQFVPQLLQTEFGYTATLAGLALSPGGAVMFVMMPLAGFLAGKIQPRYLVATGLSIVAFAMWYPTGLTADVDFKYAASLRVLLSLGLPLLFLPLTAASYVGVPGNKTNQAAALFNVARNLGGSIGVAFSQTVLQQRQQFHQSRLVESIFPSSVNYQEALARITQYFTGHGSSQSEAASQATQWIGSIVDQQAVLLSYIDIYWVFAVLALAMIPFAFLLRAPPHGRPKMH